MSVTLVTIARPAAAKRPASFFRFCVAVWDAVSGYFLRRSAIATLRELDDRALRDIGIARSQIEGAVHGFISLPDRARMS
jgi:uncharacterized protein YjiS (DUF1127 family)